MKNLMTWAVALTTVTVGFTSCGVDMPHPTDSSFETMTVKKSDIELPYKFSARMKRSERRYSNASGERPVDEDLCD